MRRCSVRPPRVRHNRTGTAHHRVRQDASAGPKVTALVRAGPSLPRADLLHPAHGGEWRTDRARSRALTSPICRLHASAPLRSGHRRRAPLPAPHDPMQITAYPRTYSGVLTGTPLASKPGSESLRRLWGLKSTARAEESPEGVSQESERAKTRLWHRSCDNGPRERIGRKSSRNEESPEGMILEALCVSHDH